MLSSFLRRLLVHPLTAGLQLDDPATVELRRQIIASKPFLQAIYDQWYRLLTEHLPALDGKVLELGSGPGYCERFIPDLITSETFLCRGVRLVADAQRLPFRAASLRAIVFTDVLHHVPDVRRFFAEASRSLLPGGRILMIEPWVSPWSRLVFARFHHEPFHPEAAEWSLDGSEANIALPWIVFVRDRRRFENEFPGLLIDIIKPLMPFRYLLSGGVTLRALAPAVTHPVWRRLEDLLEPQMAKLAMFAFISVRKH